MPKDRQPTLIPTTSDHLSRAIETILRRFPKSDRPTKNALLNDLAGAIAPGKNWGGLLAMHRSAIKAEPAGKYPPGDVIQALLWLPEDTQSPKLPVGAVMRRFNDSSGFLGLDILQDADLMADFNTPLGDDTALGFTVDINASGYTVEVSPIPSLIISRDGLIEREKLYPSFHPASLCRVALEVVQNVYTADIHTYLTEESISDATLIISPMIGACVVPQDARSLLRNGKHIEAYDIAALRFLLPEGDSEGLEVSEDYIQESLQILLRLTEATLPSIVKGEHKFRIDLHTPHFSAFDWQPIMDVIPSPPWNYDYITGKPSGAWDSDPDPASYRIGSVLSEALSFASDFLHIAVLDPLHIVAEAHDPLRRDVPAQVGNSWKIVTWRDGQLGEWSLTDPIKHGRLRRLIEAWSEKEGLSFVETKVLPKGSITLALSRASRRNPSHWERALTLFKTLG